MPTGWHHAHDTSPTDEPRKELLEFADALAEVLEAPVDPPTHHRVPPELWTGVYKDHGKSEK